MTAWVWRVLAKSWRGRTSCSRELKNASAAAALSKHDPTLAHRLADAELATHPGVGFRSLSMFLCKWVCQK